MDLIKFPHSIKLNSFIKRLSSDSRVSQHHIVLSDRNVNSLYHQQSAGQRQWQDTPSWRPSFLRKGSRGPGSGLSRARTHTHAMTNTTPSSASLSSLDQQHTSSAVCFVPQKTHFLLQGQSCSCPYKGCCWNQNSLSPPLFHCPTDSEACRAKTLPFLS